MCGPRRIQENSTESELAETLKLSELQARLRQLPEDPKRTPMTLGHGMVFAEIVQAALDEVTQELKSLIKTINKPV